jgi:hypothetical protein
MATVEFPNLAVKNEGNIVTRTILRESALRKTFSFVSILKPYVSAAQDFNVQAFRLRGASVGGFGIEFDKVNVFKP